ncbi:hypothetical protein [Sphingomonas arenae]|uniref:hypothetical protein n=1 Tax=Sphingomonas arenae TaxID=2812555 RepID=UPI001967E11B|nr:hypothetical protein [Sphingomonas arenae]
MLPAALAAMLLATSPPRVITPPAGSAERAAILDTLRPAVEARLRGKVEFVVDTLRSDGAWAFVVAEPQRPGGTRIDGLALFGEDWDNMDGLRVDAVLRRKQGHWEVVEYVIGATDAWYCGGAEAARRRVVGC